MVHTVLAATVVGLGSSILYTNHLAALIDARALSIATDASPAIEHLTAARGHLLQVELAAEIALQGREEGATLDPGPFETAMDGLRAELSAYAAIPFYPYEQKEYQQAEQAVRELSTAISRFLALLAADDVRAARSLDRTELSAVGLRLDQIIQDLVAFNAEQQHRMGLEIPALLYRARGVGYLLGVGTTVLALFTLGLVISGFRRHARLLTAQKNETDEYAREAARLYHEAVAATRAREELLAMVSHDLRNPLNNVRICAQMLGKVPGDPEKVSEVAERIDRATDRMGQLISDLLDAAKIEGGRLQPERRPERVRELVESAVEGIRVIAAEKSIQIRVASFPSSLTALCDRHLVLRVFSNLLGNAIKFSPTGAAIDVRAKELGGEILFSIKDMGPGIPPEHLPHAFDRYWQQTNDRRGTGLGLYIVKGIVEAHGGRIWIDSVVGQGTEVQFTLPSAHTVETSVSRSL